MPLPPERGWTKIQLVKQSSISGERVSCVWCNSIFVAGRDYLESADTREFDGVY
jgi:hypothetical protein